MSVVIVGEECASRIDSPSIRPSRRPWTIPLPLAAVILVNLLAMLAFYRMFVFDIEGQRVWATSDDIYISACYARNVAEGHGAVWYPGAPRVEGVTNPLWVGVLTIVHLLPFYSESQLGIYLCVMNAILLAITFVFLWKAIKQISARARNAPLMAPGWMEALVLSMGLWAFPYWLSEGFETGLLAVLASGGFLLALKEATPRRYAAIGLAAGLAFWTRMDGVLYFVPAAMILFFSRDTLRKKLVCLGAMACVAALFIGLLFVARQIYYGDWLPNTYYLKLAGWPLINRLEIGWRQNWPHVPTLMLTCLPFIIPEWRRRLGKAAFPVAVCFLLHALSVLYSTHNGGDSWRLRMGYDRFMVTGGIFLLIGVAVVTTVSAQSGWKVRVPLLMFALSSMLMPALLMPEDEFIPKTSNPFKMDTGIDDFLKSTLLLRKERLERAWIKFGMHAEQISKPGARIALSPAGAIIYFSHRGGLDLQGKCEPYVAHHPVKPGRTLPGHNKKTDEMCLTLFMRDKPDVSREHPPESLIGNTYFHVQEKAGGPWIWVRRDSKLIRWRDVKKG